MSVVNEDPEIRKLRERVAELEKKTGPSGWALFNEFVADPLREYKPVIGIMLFILLWRLMHYL